MEQCDGPLGTEAYRSSGICGTCWSKASRNEGFFHSHQLRVAVVGSTSPHPQSKMLAPDFENDRRKDFRKVYAEPSESGVHARDRVLTKGSRVLGGAVLPVAGRMGDLGRWWAGDEDEVAPRCMACLHKPHAFAVERVS